MGAPCLLVCDLMDSIREDTGPLDRMLRMLLILDRCDNAAVAGPTVADASSSMMVSIYKQAISSGLPAGGSRGAEGLSRRGQRGTGGGGGGGGRGRETKGVGCSEPAGGVMQAALHMLGTLYCKCYTLNGHWSTWAMMPSMRMLPANPSPSHSL